MKMKIEFKVEDAYHEPDEHTYWLEVIENGRETNIMVCVVSGNGCVQFSIGPGGAEVIEEELNWNNKTNKSMTLRDAKKYVIQNWDKIKKESIEYLEQRIEHHKDTITSIKDED